jgi:hypothetical protein
VQCPSCGKTERVVIGNKQYCASCGRALEAATPGTATPQKVFSDLSPAAVITPAATPVAPTVTPAPVTEPASPATEAAISTPPAPVATAKPMTDLSPRPATVTTTTPLSQPNPAKSFHDRQAPAAGVLDLRNVTPTPVTPATTPEPTPVTTPPVASLPSVPVVHAPAPKADPITKLPEIRPLHPATTIPKPSENPLPPTFKQPVTPPAPVVSVTKSTAIGKFGSALATPAVTPAPTNISSQPIAPETTAPKSTSPLDALAPTSNLTTKLQALDNTPTSQSPETVPVSLPTAPTPELPNAVATQVNSLAKAVTPAPVSHDDALKLAMNTDVKPSFRPASVAAAIAVVTIMAGYIWVNNYPKMTVKTAAGKAGVEASVPGFMPSSYSLSGPVAYSPGAVTLNFATQSKGENVQITQKRTVWDSGSLLDNYVAKASNQYLAVQGQGLTIYLFGNNRASWVNHGIWYNIEGNNSLTRDQLLKIAYSL